MVRNERARVDYEFLDVGAGRRLERFGDRIVDRPHPAAILSPEAPHLWRDPDLRFDRDVGWTGRADPTIPWRVSVGALELELRAAESGAVGLFPEQLDNVAWVVDHVAKRVAARERAGDGPAPAVLNVFAHTGLLTLAAARAGASVAHVDASRAAVAWARRNAELSGLGDAPIRWLVDDALTFVRREARRGRRYDGILLDPPTYGHAGRRTWRLEADLPELLLACRRLAADGAFLLVTAHTAGLDDDRLADEVGRAWRPAGSREPAARTATARTTPAPVRARPLELEATSGATLRLGTAIRIPG